MVDIVTLSDDVVERLAELERLRAVCGAGVEVGELHRVEPM